MLPPSPRGPGAPLTKIKVEVLTAHAPLRPPLAHTQRAKAQASHYSSPRQLEGFLAKTERGAGNTHRAVTPLTPEHRSWASRHLTQRLPVFTKATTAKVLPVFKGSVAVTATSQLRTQLEELRKCNGRDQRSFCPQAEEQQAGATTAPKQPQTSDLAAPHPPSGQKYGIK